KVFLNPPGGKTRDQASQQATWFKKLLNQWRDDYIEQAVFVAFNLELQRMKPEALTFPFCIPSNRIRYWSYDAEAGEIREGQLGKKKIYVHKTTGRQRKSKPK
ncbi:MAG: hypothetical protein ABEI54_03230, partial [Candidatus Bipolaricaulia bacterium]